VVVDPIVYIFFWQQPFKNIVITQNLFKPNGKEINPLWKTEHITVNGRPRSDEANQESVRRRLLYSYTKIWKSTMIVLSELLFVKGPTVTRYLRR